MWERTFLAACSNLTYFSKDLEFHLNHFFIANSEFSQDEPERAAIAKVRETLWGPPPSHHDGLMPPLYNTKPMLTIFKCHLPKANNTECQH